VGQALSFTLYSRPGCGLCEEMLEELALLPAARGIEVQLINIDGDQELRERYGHKIPVLLLAGEVVCHGHLDSDEVHKALAYHR
jgi:hypothetical protein